MLHCIICILCWKASIVKFIFVKINIIVYHLVAGFELSLASGGWYTWKLEGKKLYGMSTAVMYSTPPSFHSPLSSLTNTVHRLTLLCRKFPSLFKKLSALCHQIEVTCIIDLFCVLLRILWRDLWCFIHTYCDLKYAPGVVQFLLRLILRIAFLRQPVKQRFHMFCG